jgi:hypothetical protein
VRFYEIVVESHIDKKRFKEFEDVDVSHLPDGCTRIYGKLADQSELFSLLNKIRDMNLNLLLVKQNREEKEK